MKMSGKNPLQEQTKYEFGKCGILPYNRGMHSKKRLSTNLLIEQMQDLGRKWETGNNCRGSWKKLRLEKLIESQHSCSLPVYVYAHEIKYLKNTYVGSCVHIDR